MLCLAHAGVAWSLTHSVRCVHKFTLSALSLASPSAPLISWAAMLSSFCSTCSYFNVIRPSSMRAMFKAFATEGFNSSGCAFITSSALWEKKELGADGQLLGLPEEAAGVINMNSESKPCWGTDCRNTKFTTPGARNAHDAMYVLLRGIGKVLTGSDGGSDYKANTGNARRRAVNHMRSTSLSGSKMMSGALTFDFSSNDREADNFAFKFVGTKRVNGKLVFVPVGRLSFDKKSFETEIGVSIIWPGNSLSLPVRRGKRSERESRERM